MQQQYYHQQPPPQQPKGSIIALFIKAKIRLIIGGLAGLGFGYIVGMIFIMCVYPLYPHLTQITNYAAVMIFITIIIFGIMSALSSRYCIFCVLLTLCAAISFIIPYFIEKKFDFYDYTSGYVLAAMYISALIFFSLLIFTTYFFWKLLRVYYFKDLEKPEKTVMGPVSPPEPMPKEGIQRFGRRTKYDEQRTVEPPAPSSANTPAEPAGGCCMNCGNKISPDDMFCQKCGTKIEGGEQWE
ncbi:MAG: zinc-ribbon domain-containing protein [Nanoarchaeota archaeon]|nr:zinc-ribbon domain-containing protein [Nanoarchaeota archaeon]